MQKQQDKEHFCSNPECVYNELIVKDDVYQVEIVQGSGRRILYRHQYADANGNKLKMCDFCHNAVQMIIKNKKGRNGSGGL